MTSGTGRRHSRWLGLLLLAAGFALAPGAMAADGARHVLILHAYSRFLPAIGAIDSGMRATIRTTTERPVHLYDEFLDMPRFEGPDYSRTVVSYLREKYAVRRPDVIVTTGLEALQFVLDNRASLFPGTPVVFLSLTGESPAPGPSLPTDVIGVEMNQDYGRTIDLALRLHPRARRLVLVTGASVPDRNWEAQLRAIVPRFGERVAIEFLAALPIDDLSARLGALEGDSVVFTPGFFQSGDGRQWTPRDSSTAIVAASRAPVYVPFDTFLGVGVVGGYMSSFNAVGRQIGGSVNSLLEGDPATARRLLSDVPLQLNVDWRQLQRWGVDESGLPSGAVMHFRAPSLWETNSREVVIGISIFALQFALIVLLVLERRRRRRAEDSEAKHRADLAHATRLEIASGLTASIAHEINQPLGAILSNADAAEMMLDSGDDRRAEVRQILTDIRRDDLRASEVIRRLRSLIEKREIERRPFEINELLADLESVLRTEVRRRRMTLRIHPAPAPERIVGDRVQVLQVLINLVINAMDAMADMPDGRRTVAVTADRGANGIVIQVRDSGDGIAPENLPRVFQSFFSTKTDGMGMGLSISRTLVEADGGRIGAENGPGRGAVFQVELPVTGESTLKPSASA
jgi:signal transduction histidine kinase